MRRQLSVLVFALLAASASGHARWKCPAPRDENDANGKASVHMCLRVWVWGLVRVCVLGV